MPPRYLQGLTALAVGLMACQGTSGSDAGALPPASQAVPATSLLRLPRTGGTARLYASTDLAPVEWRGRGKMPALQLAVGFDLDQALAYAVDSGGGLQALDLATGTTRLLTDGVSGVVLGPEGTLWVVDGKDGVTRVRHRLAKPTGNRLPARPSALYGTVDRQLIAIEPGDSARAVVVGEGPGSATLDIPTTRTAASPWGDLLAVATPSGIELWPPRGGASPRHVRVGGVPSAVRFSAAGHRVYVAREEKDLAVVDRYAGERIRDIDLPGAAGGLRVAPYGAWLLARPAEGDSIWIVNLGSSAYVGTLESPWDLDLPTVIGDATLLLREGKDVVARDLTEPGFPETGRIKGASADLFMPVQWVPKGSQPEPPPVRPDTSRAAGTPADSAGPAPAAATVYLQVSRSQNPAWAQELAAQIRDEGFPALVLTPRPGEEAYRVVVGPYPSRDEAEAAGRLLGRPSFIFQP